MSQGNGSCTKMAGRSIKTSQQSKIMETETTTLIVGDFILKKSYLVFGHYFVTLYFAKKRGSLKTMKHHPNCPAAVLQERTGDFYNV